MIRAELRYVMGWAVQVIWIFSNVIFLLIKCIAVLFYQLEWFLLNFKNNICKHCIERIKKKQILTKTLLMNNVWKIVWTAYVQDSFSHAIIRAVISLVKNLVSLWIWKWAFKPTEADNWFINIDCYIIWNLFITYSEF